MDITDTRAVPDDTTTQNGHRDLTREEVQALIVNQGSDEEFVDDLISKLQDPYAPYLYMSVCKARCARIRQTKPILYESKLLRAALLFLGPAKGASWERDIDGLSRRQVSTFAQPQTATTLLSKTFDPLRCFVGDILAEGLTILAGKPKKGKSYLMLDMSLAIAVGRQAFQHFDTEKSQVLYISLEDGERRLQRRLRAIQPNLATPQGLDFLYTFPRLADGAFEALQHYATRYQVIIIDVLGRVLPPQTQQRKSLSEYQELTDALGPIQGLAQDNRIAIVLIDHLRKASAEDAGDAIMGSQGKFGVVDHALIYERKGEETDAVMRILSRDLDEQKIVLSMVAGHLEFVGKGEIYELDAEQNRIIKVLEEEGRAMNATEIMRALGLAESHYARFRKVLYRLYTEDRIGKTQRGLYRLYGDDREEGMPF